MEKLQALMRETELTALASDPELIKPLMARLSEVLDLRSEKIDKNRKRYLRRKALWGALLGAAFAKAGDAPLVLIATRKGPRRTIAGIITVDNSG